MVYHGFSIYFFSFFLFKKNFYISIDAYSWSRVVSRMNSFLLFFEMRFAVRKVFMHENVLKKELERESWKMNKKGRFWDNMIW